jgi:hypothetical protein
MAGRRAGGVAAPVFAAVGLVLLALSLYHVLTMVTGMMAEGDDFQQYWTGATQVAAGQSPYAWLAEGRPQEGHDYVYPPLPALLLAPFALFLDYPTMRWLWLGLSVLALGVGLALIWRTSGLFLWTLRGARPHAIMMDVVALLPFAVTLQWANGALGFGQLTPELLLVLAAAFAASGAGRWVAAGVLVALGAWLRVFPALLGGYLLLRRHWRATLACTFAALALGALSVAVLGWEAHWLYLTRAGPAYSQWLSGPFNVSVTGFFTRLFIPNLHTTPIVAADALGRAAIVISMLLILTASGHAVWRAAGREQAAFSLALVTSLLLSPSNGTQNLLLAVLPLAVVAARVRAAWPRDLRWLLVVIILLSMPTELCDLAGVREWCLNDWTGPLRELPWRVGWGNLLISGPFFGLLALWALLVRLCLARDEPEPAETASGAALVEAVG